jgi:hypothetical protein
MLEGRFVYYLCHMPVVSTRAIIALPHVAKNKTVRLSLPPQLVSQLCVAMDTYTAVGCWVSSKQLSLAFDTSFVVRRQVVMEPEEPECTRHLADVVSLVKAYIQFYKNWQITCTLQTSMNKVH